ncbi:hypothetical protein KH388_00675 [Serratia rubidaea]|nr:hypothetical protein [Serratia rubidaea]
MKYRKKRTTSIRESLDFMVDMVKKYFPVLVVFSTLYGSLLLFNYCVDYSVPFINVYTTNYMLVFGILSLVIIMSVLVLPITLTFTGEFLAEKEHDRLVSGLTQCIFRDKELLVYFFIKIFQFSSFGLCLYFDSLPVYFYSSIVFVLSVVAAIITFKDFKGERLRSVVSFLFYYTMDTLICFSILITIYLLFPAEIKSINNVLKALVVVAVFIALSMSSGPFKGKGAVKTKNIMKKNRHAVRSMVIVLIVAEGIFASPFLMSDFIAPRVSSVIGFGNLNECFYAKDLTKYDIPQDMVSQTIRIDIVKLSIVARIGGEYYITTRLGEKAGFKFEADKLTEVACPMGLVKKSLI